MLREAGLAMALLVTKEEWRGPGGDGLSRQEKVCPGGWGW